MSDSTTNSLIALWAEHRADGKARGFDQRDQWGAAPESAYMEADQWVRQDLSFQTIIGARLAYQALWDFQNKEES